jgi:hypothetical protein
VARRSVELASRLQLRSWAKSGILRRDSVSFPPVANALRACDGTSFSKTPLASVTTSSAKVGCVWPFVELMKLAASPITPRSCSTTREFSAPMTGIMVMSVHNTVDVALPHHLFAFSSHIDPGWIQIIDSLILHNPAYSATISLSVATACFQKICDILPIHRCHAKSHMSPGFVTSRNQDVS